MVFTITATIGGSLTAAAFLVQDGPAAAGLAAGGRSGERDPRRVPGLPDRSPGGRGPRGAGDR